MGRAHDEAIDAEIRAMPRREPKKTPCRLTAAQKLAIEAHIVEGLNTAWPESHSDEQTWCDKREAIERVLERGSQHLSGSRAKTIGVNKLRARPRLPVSARAAGPPCRQPQE
jgi:hypothetical protein